MAAWERTGDGTGAQLLLVSETGMGASSLLEELAALAGAASTSVVAHPFHHSIPYAALAELARRLAGADGAETDQALAGSSRSPTGSRRTSITGSSWSEPMSSTTIRTRTPIR